MNTKTCKCFACQREFEKAVSEYNRTIKRNARHFCSRECSALISAKENVQNGIFFPHPENLDPGNLRDDFTPFRWFLARVRSREHKKANDLTLEYLKEIWEQQKGICCFTGWKMHLPLGTAKWGNEPKPQRASLDRIDSKKGYIQGNVRFVCVIANYAKNDFDDTDVLAFCKAVTEQSNEQRTTCINTQTNPFPKS